MKLVEGGKKKEQCVISRMKCKKSSPGIRLKGAYRCFAEENGITGRKTFKPGQKDMGKGVKRGGRCCLRGVVAGRARKRPINAGAGRKIQTAVEGAQNGAPICIGKT